MTEVSATNRTGAPPAHRRPRPRAPFRRAPPPPRRARPARARAARRGGTAPPAPPRSRVVARTVAAHALNSSAAAPWMIALRANRPRAASSAGSAPTWLPARNRPVGMTRPPYVRSDSPRRPEAAARVEQVHRHRVGPLEALERLSGRAAALAVHRREHRHLRDRTLHPQPLGDRRVEVVGPGGRRERRVARDHRQHPRLDLPEVGAHEHVTLVGRHAGPQHGRQVVQPVLGRHPAGRTVARGPPPAQPVVGPRRSRRATGSRTSSRSARRAASRAGRRRAGAPCGRARAPTCGCWARPHPPRQHLAAPARGCAGRSTRGPGRAQHQRVAGPPGGASSASEVGRGPSGGGESSSVRARSRAARRGAARGTAPPRPTPRAPCRPAAPRSPLPRRAAAAPSPGPAAHASRCPRSPQPLVVVAAQVARGVDDGVGVRGRASDANSNRSPVGGAGTPSSGMPCAAAQHWPAVALQPPWRSRWASATSQARATATPAATRGVAASPPTTRPSAETARPRVHPPPPRPPPGAGW